MERRRCFGENDIRLLPSKSEKHICMRITNSITFAQCHVIFSTMKIMYISVSLADVMLCFTKTLDQKIKSKILIMFEEMGSIP